MLHPDLYPDLYIMYADPKLCLFFPRSLPVLRGGVLEGVAAGGSSSTDMTSSSDKASTSAALVVVVVGAARLLVRLALSSLSERKHVGQFARLG